MALEVGDLIFLLKEFNPKTPVVIDNIQIQGISLEYGRTKNFHLNEGWLPFERGNQQALRFTKFEELSDGTIKETKF